MASIVLGTVGSALGGAAGGTIGAALGASLGRYVGASLDGAMFGSGALASIEGPRLPDLAVQTSTYGKMIPLVYGMVRMSGNIIWSRPIKERVTRTSSSSGGGKGGGGGATQTTTTYSYSVSMAVAICEGAIDEVLRIWADAKQIDLKQGRYRIYKGTEDQLPDSYIESFEGVEKTPAYRGLAYIVVEDFPLGEFGNRIPNFTFEVRRKAEAASQGADVLENRIKGITLIPGSGEFVYDTRTQYKVSGEAVAGGWAQQGARVPINMHNPDGVANALLALDQLENTLPNLEWVSLVVTWFGTSMNAGSCQILPGVEFKDNATTEPDAWGVGARGRNAAHLIAKEDDRPRYGGTPADDSVVRLVQALKAKGWKVMFYPMFFMDVDGKPWRGHVTGMASQVGAFFTKTNGYNQFIMHYAELMTGQVDAFVIGSELVGLTKVTAAAGEYPAVDALVDLAGQVRGEMGSDVAVTYAADWSEYHHTDGGWYNLDPLWACEDIDMVGIDAYFPLSDAPQQGYDVDALIDGWDSGEGYDFYYADAARTDKQPLGAAYAWKNIGWWWSNAHTNPDGSVTAWVPESKKIWLTEYGFPSVDGAANEPNVFFDASTAASAFPRFSRGRVDFRAQRAALMATERRWQDSNMIERMFIWAWDARPYPYWPDLLSVWSDGPNWKYGHWVNGKLGASGLAAIVRDICRRAGLTEDAVDVSALTELVEGYVIASPESARRFIEQLMTGYFFDAVESDGLLKFVPRGGAVAASVDAQALVPLSEEDGSAQVLSIRRAQEVELPQRVNVLYINRTTNYLQGNQFSQRQVTESRDVRTVSLPLVFSDQAAKVLADQWLYSSWVSRTAYECYLSMRYAGLEPTDVLDVQMQGVTHRMRVTDVMHSRPGVIRVHGVAEDVASYDVYLPPAESGSRSVVPQETAPTRMEMLDLPLFPYDEAPMLRVALTGLGGEWRGAVLYRSDDGGGSYAQIAAADAPAVVGTALDVLAEGSHAVLDEKNSVDVLLLGEAELENVSLTAMLNGANVALLGQEIIQFMQAEWVAEGRYRLSGLLRGRLGTEQAMNNHVAGERFVLLNSRVEVVSVGQNVIDLPRSYKPVTIGQTLGSTDAQNFTYQGRAWKPYAPVHLQAEWQANGDIDMQWVRRARSGGAWRDGVDVPLGEAQERYMVMVRNGGIVVAEYTVNEPQFTYTVAMQVQDFGAAQSSISWQVCQLSDIVGRGEVAEAES